MTDLHARLLAEIERREGVANRSVGFDRQPIDQVGLAYLAALRGVVELHTSHPVRYIHQDGTWTEAPACNTCDCEDGDWPCKTLRCVATALDVTP